MVLDDLKPGYDMAMAAGVPFAAAAWAGDYPIPAAFLKARCRHYCQSIEDFARLVLP